MQNFYAISIQAYLTHTQHYASTTCSAMHTSITAGGVVMALPVVEQAVSNTINSWYI